MAKRLPVRDDDLPAELEFLRVPALTLVDAQRQIVGCGQVDFDGLERALRRETAGLTPKQAAAKKSEQRNSLHAWLVSHEDSSEPLAIGLRFVAELLRE